MKPKNTTWWKWLLSFQLYVFALLALVAAVFGFQGYTELYGNKFTLADKVYYTFALFFLNTAVEPGTDLPWCLNIARFLAPAPTFYALLRTGMVLLVGLHNTWSRRRLDSHEIVCGLGKLGQFLATNSSKENKVVAITPDPKPEIKTFCENYKIGLVAGNASDPNVLKESGILRASTVYICTSSDNLNLEIVHAIQEVRETNSNDGDLSYLKCYVSVDDLYLTDLIRTHHYYKEESSARMLVNPFNNYKTVARSLWRRMLNMAASHGLCFPLEATNPNTANVILVGFALEPEAIALQLAQQAHFANGTQTRLTIIDEQLAEKDAAQTDSLIATSLEGLDQVLDFRKVPANPHSQEAQKNISYLVAQKDTLTTVIVAGNDDSENLRLALHINKQLGGKENTKTPVFVRLKESSGLNDFLALEENKKAELQQVYGFGIFEETFTDKNILSVDLNKRAEAIHEDFRQKNHTATDSEANKPWGHLREYVKEANRAPAEHIEVKCLAIGYDISDPESSIIPSPEEIEANIDVLSRMEHERWMANKKLNGWRPGEVTDNKAMTHKNLIPWEALPEEEKEKDRSQVRLIPKLLSDANLIE